MTQAASSSARTIAILRRSDGLHELSVDIEEGKWNETLRPLTSAPQLTRAWEALSAVREIKRSVLTDIQTILHETVADPESERPQLPALSIDAPPPPHRATAANPRAYKGTKDRPPKPRRPNTMDLRPFLCTPGGQDRLLALLTAKLGPIELHEAARDLPPGYRRYFAWTLCGQAVAPEFYWQLNLDTSPTLRRQVAHLFARQSAPRSLAWCRLLSQLDTNLQSDTLGWLWASEMDCLDLDVEEQEDIIKAIQAAQILEDKGVDRIHFLTHALASGHKAKDLCAGFELASDFGHIWSPDFKQRPASSSDCAIIRKLVETRVDPGGTNAYLPTSLWTGCGALEGLGEVFDRIPWDKFETDQALELAERFGHLAPTYFDDASPLTPEQWRAIKPQLIELGEVISQIEPRFQAKAVSYFRACLFEESVPFTLPSLPAFIKRFCRTPFASQGETDEVIERLAYRCDTKLLTAVLGAPDASFVALESATKRANQAYLVSAGLDILCRDAAALFERTFIKSPKILFQVAEGLGNLSTPLRVQLVANILKGPLIVDVNERSGAEFVSLFHLHGASSGTNPIPKQLRRHLDGETTLRPAQVERHEQLIREAWDVVLLQALRESAMHRAQLGLHEEVISHSELSAQMQHALIFQLQAENHRRGLRKLIRASTNGDHAYLVNHPINQAWLLRHPAIDRETWLHGPSIEGDIDGVGKVRLSIERDPLEALRLGTYVGSCLGLGGDFMYSAAAVVLDINKQVVFARDARGRFLARQVIAIRSDDKLECFEVYPSSQRQMLELFREFDDCLRTQLDIQFATDDEDDNEEDETETELLIATNWWHDGLWDFDCEPQSDDLTS